MQAVTFLPTEDFLSKYSLAVNADESSQHAGTGKTVPDSFDAIFRSLFANKTVTATVAHILPNSYFGLPNDLLLRAAEFGQRYGGGTTTNPFTNRLVVATDREVRPLNK